VQYRVHKGARRTELVEDKVQWQAFVKTEIQRVPNSNSEWSRCVLMYLYRNNVVVEPTAAKRRNLAAVMGNTRSRNIAAKRHCRLSFGKA
jgi:hypothetical protein